MSNKKPAFYILAFVFTTLLCFVLVFLSAFFGNPISSFIVNRKAPEYISRKYPDTDFYVNDVFYSFKDSRYHAIIKSPSSEDSSFSIDMNLSGEVIYDTYKSDVTGGMNVWRRISQEYREISDPIFESASFPYEHNIAFADLPIISDEPFQQYGIQLDELVPDKEYDIRELAKTSGQIVFYANSDEVNTKKACEILLGLKSTLDENNIPFYSIDFVLQNKSTNIGVREFLYSDIYSDGLEARFDTAAKELQKYYATQDAEKFDAINSSVNS